MAQLKDLIVNGATRLIGEAFTSKVYISQLADSTGSTGTNGQVLKSDGSTISWSNIGTAAAKGVTDATANTKINSSDENLITARAVYYGLPIINNSNNYTRGTSIYAPSTGGTANYYLKANGATATPTWAAFSNSTVGLGNVSNNTALNNTTGAKGDIIYWSAANTPAHLTNTSSTTKKFLSITSQVPSWSDVSKSDVGLGNVENKSSATIRGEITSTNVTDALGYTPYDSTNPDGYVSSSGVTSITIQTSAPLTGGTSVACTTSKTWTIGFSKVNPYYVLAGPSSGTATAVPSFRALIAADLPTVTVTKGGSGLTSMTYKNAMLLGNATTVTNAMQVLRIGNGALYATATDAKPSFGTLPIAQGGTCATNAADAWTNLGGGAIGKKDSLEQLTLFTKTYDGTAEVTITAADIGLSSSMTFKGVITNTLSDGATTTPVTLKSGGTLSPTTANNGWVVLDATGLEYVWDGDSWTQLGFATDFALNNHMHGNISNDGKVTTTAAAASNMKLLVTNSSSQVVAANISLGNSETTFLTNKGTWKTPTGTYTLPIASSTTLGGIKVGTGLTATSAGVLNHSNSITAGTAGTTASTSGTTLDIPYLTYDAQGHITAAGVHEHTITAVNGNARVFYGICSTAAGTYQKDVTCDSYTDLQVGDVVLVKFNNTNTATANNSLTLKVGSTAAKPIKKQYCTSGTATVLAHKNELNNQGIHEFIYNGSCWVYSNGDYNSTYTITSVFCGTASATAAKVSGNATYYALRAGNMFEVTTRYANTTATALTFNVNGTGAKPIYINGKPSSSSNYTLPAGKYLVYYDGTSYNFYTNGGAKFGAINITTASYGETLPTTGAPGQLFFQTSTGNMYELPAGGSAGQVLAKNSAADRDVVWSNSVTNCINATNATNSQNNYTAASTVKAYVVGSTENSTGYKSLVHNASVYTQDAVLFGAAWNDYAEFRKNNPEEVQEAGRCVRECGDGSLALTTERLQRGCEIISDTFGFAIGQDEDNGYNTPIAVSGRVLAYIYEGKEFAKKHIGWPVCSGPNGTVSVMTEEEEEKYSSRIIGIISEVPDYETWGAKSIAVKERVWIRIK